MEIEKTGREEITGKAILFRATNEKALLKLLFTFAQLNVTKNFV